MHIRQILWLLTFGSALVPSPARGDDPPATLESQQDKQFDPQATLEGERKKELERLDQEVVGKSARAADHAAEVARFQLEDGQLIFQTSQPPSEARERIKIADLQGFCVLDVRGNEVKEKYWTPTAFNFLYWNLNKPGQIVELTSVLWTPFNLQVARDSESLADQSTVTLIQSPTAYDDTKPGVSLRVSRSGKLNDADSLRIALSAPSFAALVANYPRETAEHLEPIFHDLHQSAALFAVEPKLAWQIFAEALVPDPATIEKIQRIIKQLDADAFADRDAASAELEKLGQSAAAFLGRMDRGKLSPEQRSRIDLFLSAYHPLDALQAKSLRSDGNFLLNCLYNQDKPIRVEALRHLQEIYGKQVEFNLDAQASERAEQIFKLRKLVLPEAKSPAAGGPTSSPATQPSQTGE